VRIVVTGSSGFVGGYLLRLLAASGHEAVAMGRNPGPGGIAWDMAAGGAPELPAGVDAVIHLAQARAYRNFPGDAAGMFAVNVAAAHALLDASVRAGVGRICLVSSGSVYEPFDAPMVEDAALAPPGFLGASKLAGEIVARPYGKLAALSILRLFAPYGPGQTGRLIPELVRRVAAGERIDVSEDGEGMRMTPTHVDDVCRILLASVEHGWTGVINVASREILTIGEIARHIGDALGREPQFIRSQPPSRPLVPDLTRLSKLYDLSAMRRFRDAAGELAGRG
jgi:UDP-glucose 4-epimerase